jgi:hypothetical protein
MENEDNIINLANYYDGPYGGVPSRIATPQPTFNEFPDNKEIVIPSTFKDVVVKMCPEILNIVSVGYREQTVYNPTNFAPEYKYLVGVDLYFDNHNGMKKSKNEYGKEIGDYFKMTYGSEFDFISFHVQSFIFPPEKTTKDKFFELFGKV